MTALAGSVGSWCCFECPPNNCAEYGGRIMQQTLRRTSRPRSRSDRHHATIRHRDGKSQRALHRSEIDPRFVSRQSIAGSIKRAHKVKRPKRSAGHLEEVKWQTVTANPTAGGVQ